MFRNERRPGSCPPGAHGNTADNSSASMTKTAAFRTPSVFSSLIRFAPVISLLNIIVIVIIL